MLELSFDQAMLGIANGTIKDAKTIMLLQYAALKIFAGSWPSRAA